MTPKQYLRSVLIDPLQLVDSEQKECNLCGHKGRFWSFGFPARRYSRCPSCSALERHRLYGFMLKDKPDMIKGKRVLHFAPEQQIVNLVTANVPKSYDTADLEPGRAQHAENIMALSFKDGSFDLVIANHVMEHIPDDAKAFSEIRRVLTPGGIFLACVPIVESWERSYENENIKTEKDRVLHFGQNDHVRFYGRDFITRFEAAGFKVERYQAPPELCVRHGLNFGETVFIGTRI